LTPSTPFPADTSLATSVARFGSGQSVLRLEDDKLLVGAGQFAGDVSPADQVHLFFLRSPYPHARIVSIDSVAALAMPGVLKIVTGAELVAAGVKPIPGSAFKRMDPLPCAAPERRALAHERVRFVGEAVVAVVALTLQQARDAAEAIEVDYAELPVLVNLDDATAAGAPVLNDKAVDNIAGETRYGNVQATAEAFAKAAHVVKLDVVNQRLSALSLEPRTVLAIPDPATGRLTIRMSTQMPSGVRNSVCDLLGMERADVRVVVGDVGGGFGMKTGIYPEDLTIAFCARDLQRPIKWGADRSRIGARRQRQNSRVASGLSGQCGRLPDRHRRDDSAFDWPLGTDQRLRHPDHRFSFQGGADQHLTYWCLSRCRSSGGDLQHGAADG